MLSIELHKIDFKKFLEAVDLCKGNVFLVTEEGDRLNLKSKLSQFIGIAKLVDGGVINKAKVVCENPEDDSLLFRFNLYGTKVLDEEQEQNSSQSEWVIKYFFMFLATESVIPFTVLSSSTEAFFIFSIDLKCKNRFFALVFPTPSISKSSDCRA